MSSCRSLGGELGGAAGSGTLGADVARMGSGADAGTGEGAGGTPGAGGGSGSRGAGAAAAGCDVMGVYVTLGGVGAGREGGGGALGADGGSGSRRVGVGTARSDVRGVSAILMGAGLGRDGGGRSRMVRAGVAICACGLRDTGVGCRVPALGLVAVARVRWAAGPGRALRVLLTAIEAPGIALMALLTSWSRSSALASRFCCADTNCCRLSSVARSLAASEATSSRCLTYRCIPVKNVFGVSLLERPGAVVHAENASVTRPSVLTTSVNSSWSGNHILFSMSASPNCSTNLSGLWYALSITNPATMITVAKKARMTANSSEIVL